MILKGDPQVYEISANGVCRSVYEKKGYFAKPDFCHFWHVVLMLGKAVVPCNPLYTHVFPCNPLYLRNRKHVPCFYRVIQTQVEVWENEKCCGNTSRMRVFPQLFRVIPNFHECLYNSIETRSTCFLFLLENTTTRKRKTTC